MRPTLLLAVHGTRDPDGLDVTRALARGVRERAGVPVRLAFADVRDPDVGDVAATISGPIVVVPAFLAAGYHVRVDIPGQLARVGRFDARITGALGGDPRLVAAAARRLREAGWRAPDAVVLAAAGSSDPGALAEVADAAGRLAETLGSPVRTGYIATGTPTVAQTVAALRAEGHRRVAIASWLLAPGLFHQRLAGAGADLVAGPLCPDSGVAAAVVARYREAVAPARV
ncbi:sirohydrochlorin chelatase [Marinactinospora thermotolerans]|uniref:sirohydrochlorin chelatase n=1 Tax=Marinactinospora thermotolerans TaxID=531310 RepID=UPI001F3BC725|nr:sirohydrochlorin chelatase [Marinactinospora thermotolerans]